MQCKLVLVAQGVGWAGQPCSDPNTPSPGLQLLLPEARLRLHFLLPHLHASLYLSS